MFRNVRSGQWPHWCIADGSFLRPMEVSHGGRTFVPNDETAGDPCPGDATPSAKVREMLFATPHQPAVAWSVLAYATCGKVGADDHAEATLRSFAIHWVPRVGAVLFVVRSIAEGSSVVYSMSLGEGWPYECTQGTMAAPPYMTYEAPSIYRPGRLPRTSGPKIGEPRRRRFNIQNDGQRRRRRH
jgi:hypothetical protein